MSIYYKYEHLIANAHILFFISQEKEKTMSTKAELEKEIMHNLEYAIEEKGATIFLVETMKMAENLDKQIEGFSDDDVMELKRLVDENVDFKHCLLTVLHTTETDEWLSENVDFVESAANAVGGFTDIYRNELIRRGILSVN